VNNEANEGLSIADRVLGVTAGDAAGEKTWAKQDTADVSESLALSFSRLIRLPSKGDADMANTPRIAVIRLVTHEPCILTTEEYEQAQREVLGRVLAADDGVSDRILIRLLTDNANRYMEAKAANSTTKEG
jgi:hypothetical protein